MMKALFARAGLPQVEYHVLVGRDAAAEARCLEELGLPVFVKPANLGSSVAVAKVKAPGALGAALDDAFAYDRKVLVEAGVDAREIEVAILGNDAPEASVPGEIVPDREFYDYDSKYSAGSRTELHIPARIDATTAEEVRRLGVAAFRAVDAAGFARVDFFLDRRTGRLVLNEINTIPGFTSISMYPKLWEASGVPYPDLLARLVSLGMERHAGARGCAPTSAPERAVRAPRASHVLLTAILALPAAAAPADARVERPHDGEARPPCLSSTTATSTRPRPASPPSPAPTRTTPCCPTSRPSPSSGGSSRTRRAAPTTTACSPSPIARSPSPTPPSRATRGRSCAARPRRGPRGEEPAPPVRWQRSPASREAVRMREGLAAARSAGDGVLDLDFGLGLYDYYADTLPRFFKLVAFVLRIPGGDASAGCRPSRGSRAGGASSTTTRRGCRCSTSTPTSRGRPDRASTGSARCGGSTRAGRCGG